MFCVNTTRAMTGGVPQLIDDDYLVAYFCKTILDDEAMDAAQSQMLVALDVDPLERVARVTFQPLSFRSIVNSPLRVATYARLLIDSSLSAR